MKKLEENIWYGIFVHHSYHVIAQELDSPDRQYRRWAAVYVMEHHLGRTDMMDLIKEGLGHKYLLIIIDIPTDYINIYNNSWDSDLYDRGSKAICAHAFEDEASLYEICEQLTLDPSKFVTSWRAEYIFE